MPGSGLHYHGTTDEVCLGDRIQIIGWFSSKRAEVVYLPGISPPNEMLESNGVQQWAVLDERGNCYPILYVPAKLQLPKKFRLIARGELSVDIATLDLQ